MADKTLIQLNRFNRGGADSFANGYELKDGEPIFDLRTNRFYIGTSINNTGNSITPTVQNLYVNGQYFVPINDKKPIPTSYISDSAITTAKINNGAVTNEKIADGAVTNNKLALSEYGINLDRINIPDKSIPFDKINGYVPYDRISGKPTTTDAGTITGKIKWENLPATEFTNNTVQLNGVTYGAALCAVHAYKDQQGSVIHKKYGSQLAANTSASELQLKSPDNTILSTISGKQLAQIVGYNGEGVTFNGRISWKNVDDKPAMLNMSGTVGSAINPIFYDADKQVFVKCVPYLDAIKGALQDFLDENRKIGTSGDWKNIVQGNIPTSLIHPTTSNGKFFMILATVKAKLGDEERWLSGIGYGHTSNKEVCNIITNSFDVGASSFISLNLVPSVIGNYYQLKAVSSGFYSAKIDQIQYRIINLGSK